jgi:hypothetical protein
VISRLRNQTKGNERSSHLFRRNKSMAVAVCRYAQTVEQAMVIVPDTQGERPATSERRKARTARAEREGSGEARAVRSLKLTRFVLMEAEVDDEGGVVQTGKRQRKILDVRRETAEEREGKRQ